jgi:hypothetical protein
MNPPPQSAIFAYHDADEEDAAMAVIATRNLGLLVLAIYLIVVGVTGLVSVPIPGVLSAVLALLAGILLLFGR